MQWRFLDWDLRAPSAQYYNLINRLLLDKKLKNTLGQRKRINERCN